MATCASAVPQSTVAATGLGVVPSQPNIVHGGFSAMVTGKSIEILTVSIPMLFPTIPPFALENIASEVVGNLLDERDFLGLQLSNAAGNISDEELDEHCGRYLARSSQDIDQLLLKAQVLVRLIGSRADTETVATALRCDFDQAEAVLFKVAHMISSRSDVKSRSEK